MLISRPMGERMPRWCSRTSSAAAAMRIASGCSTFGRLICTTDGRATASVFCRQWSPPTALIRTISGGLTERLTDCRYRLAARCASSLPALVTASRGRCRRRPHCWPVPCRPDQAGWQAGTACCAYIPCFHPPGCRLGELAEPLQLGGKDPAELRGTHWCCARAFSFEGGTQGGVLQCPRDLSAEQVDQSLGRACRREHARPCVEGESRRAGRRRDRQSRQLRRCAFPVTPVRVRARSSPAPWWKGRCPARCRHGRRPCLAWQVSCHDRAHASA